jgi:hypothetical protein
VLWRRTERQRVFRLVRSVFEIAEKMAAFGFAVAQSRDFACQRKNRRPARADRRKDGGIASKTTAH